MFGLRLGDDPRVCVTTTPRPVRLLKDLVADPTTVIVTGLDVREPAAPGAGVLREIIATYEGTRLGRQEIYAEMLDVGEAPGSPGSTRPGTSPRRPSTITGSPSTSPSIAASPGTSAPCSSRSGEIGPDKHRGHRLRRLPR